jgi:2-amino-4-hydroxy-6-hydroxymethyldihydropteridine diphosphokinase
MAKIFVGLGSNIQPIIHIQEGMAALLENFPDCIFSKQYESEAVGFDGENFINSVAEFSSSLSIEEIIRILGKIEDASGRTRTGPKFSARTLDIDLLLYDDVICEEPVSLPRYEILKNAFVLWPLSELAPAALHPVVNKTYAQLWSEYPKNKQKLWEVG